MATSASPRICGRDFAHIFLHRFQRLPAHRHQTLLVSFADATQAARIHLQVRHSQPAQFRNAQAGRVHQFDHRLVAQADDVD